MGVPAFGAASASSGRGCWSRVPRRRGLRRWLAAFRWSQCLRWQSRRRGRPRSPLRSSGLGVLSCAHLIPGRLGEEVTAERCTGRASLCRPVPSSLDDVDNRDEVKAFLSSRRAKVTPEQAGLPDLQPQQACAGAAPQRGRRPGRGQRRVLRPSSSAATSAASPRACSTPWPAPCSWTRPSSRTWPTWPAPPVPRPAPAADPRAQTVRPGMARILDRDDRACRRSSTTAAWTSLAANPLAQALFAPVFADRPAGQPRPVHLPRTRAPATSGSTGSAPPTTPSPCCAPKPAATPTTRR